MVDCQNNTFPPLMLDVHEAEQHKAVGSRESQTVVWFCCFLAGISGPWTATGARPNSVSLESYYVFNMACSLNPTDADVNAYTYSSWKVNNIYRNLIYSILIAALVTIVTLAICQLHCLHILFICKNCRSVCVCVCVCVCGVCVCVCVCVCVAHRHK